MTVTAEQPGPIAADLEQIRIRGARVHNLRNVDLNIPRDLGFFAHELRNFLTTATLALSIIKSGNVGLSGATGMILDRSLTGMRTLIGPGITIMLKNYL